MADSDSILLVDDHPLFRNGLKSLIKGAFPDSAIREAGSLAEAEKELAEIDPFIVILDITLPDGNGISFAGNHIRKSPECRVFILTMHQRSGLLIQAREAGCQGYFLKEGDGSAIIAALKSEDKAFSVSPQMKDHLKAVEEYNGIVQRYAFLTRREKEVFRLFAEGLGYKEVAWKLGISPRTASVHRYNIFGKLNISSDVELVKAAREVGLLI